MDLIVLPEWNETFLNKNIGSLFRFYINRKTDILVLLRNKKSFDQIVVDGMKIPSFCYSDSLFKLLLFIIPRRKKINCIFWSYLGYRENLIFWALGIPYVVKSDSFDDFNGSLSRKIKTYIDKKASLVITETNSNCVILRNKGFTKLMVLPNSFEIKNRLCSTKFDRHTFVSLGRFHEDKAHERVLYVLECLPAYSWTFIGDISSPEYYNEFMIKANSKGLLDRITILPAISNRHELIRAIQNFGWLINLSKVEGLPNRFIDAFAAGLPIISLDVGLCSELIFDGSNGLLFQSLDVMINRLNNCKFNLQEFRKKSFESFEPYNFDMLERINHIYEGCHFE